MQATAKQDFLRKIAIVVIVALLMTLVPTYWTPEASAATCPSGATCYYVDSVGGNDANNGTSPTSAWKTLSKVNAKTFASGNHILLKAGSYWNEQLYPKGSGSSGSPIVVDMYGSGAKPIVDYNVSAPRANGGPTNSAGAVFLKNQSYWELNNLEVRNDLGNGISVISYNNGTNQYIRIRNMTVYDTGANGILLSSSHPTDGTGTVTKFNNVIIENNTIIRPGDQAGIRSEATIGKLHTNLIVRGNTVQNAGFDGIVVTDAVDPLIVYNKVDGSGQIATECIAGIWVYETQRALVQFNVSSNTKNTYGTCDRNGFDDDIGAVDSIFQYNYSYNNAGGFMLIMNNAKNTTVRYNISQNDGSYLFKGQSTSADDVKGIYNNTFYTASNLNTTFSNGNFPITNSFFRNNIWHNAGSGASTEGLDSRKNLVYKGVNSSYDPKFANPGSGGSTLNSVDGYKLTSGSAALSAGLVITDNGGRDYYGNSVSSSTVPNVGADNAGAGSGTPPATSLLYEAENLSAAATDTRTNYPDSGASGGKYDLLGSNAAGDNIAYTLNVAEAGTYNVEVIHRKHSNRGIYQLQVNGTNLGTTKNTYASGGLYETVTIGSVTLSSSGNQIFTFAVTGKDASSSDYMISIDAIRLTKVTSTSSTYEAENLTATVTDARNNYSDPAASGGKYDLLGANAVNDNIAYTVNVPESGTYAIRVIQRTHNNRGIYQLAVNGSNVGAQQDTYSSSGAYATVDLGSVTFGSSGNQTFTFKVTGKNASSSDYLISIDAIQLIK